MSLAKFVKWFASFLRVAATRIYLGSRVSWPKGGKPIFIGRGACIRVGAGARLILGESFYLSENALIQVNPNAQVEIDDCVFLNSNARIVSAEHIKIGRNTLFGPNCCVYDHDHVIDSDGVHAQLMTTPVVIGSHCWVGANSLVTRGVRIADRACVGGVCRYALPQGGRRLCRRSCQAHQELRNVGRGRER